ncbi:MAG: HpcH/HpaI aldolase/citrate lyase family protein [Thermocrispum sp.]
MSDADRLRSVLFVPGTRPDRLAKALSAGADAVVVDLEDAVAATDKDAARRTALRALQEVQRPADLLLLVRVNPVGSAWFADDVAVARRADGAMLPKYQQPDELAELRDGLGSGVIFVGLETGRGVADSRALLAAPVPPDGAYFGAEDYIADLGGRRSADGDEVLYARSQVCLAAHLAGVAAVDQAVADVGDDERFRADAERGRALGYAGKICIHPRQVALANEAFSPSAQEVAHAKAVLDASAAGVAVINGQMVDDVHVRMARRLLAPGK